MKVVEEEGRTDQRRRRKENEDGSMVGMIYNGAWCVYTRTNAARFTY